MFNLPLDKSHFITVHLYLFREWLYAGKDVDVSRGPMTSDIFRTIYHLRGLPGLVLELSLLALLIICGAVLIRLNWQRSFVNTMISIMILAAFFLAVLIGFAAESGMIPYMPVIIPFVSFVDPQRFMMWFIFVGVLMGLTSGESEEDTQTYG